MVKRILALALSFSLTISLVGCGAPASSVVSSAAPNSNASETTARSDWRPYDEDYQMLRTDRDATGKFGVVSTSNYNASRIGIEVMEAGGNAIDAAVAVSFALGVAEPLTSGLGGGGFMLIHSAKTGEDVFIDYREVAPMNASPDMWTVNAAGGVEGNEKARGGKSVAVPGEVAGMLYALENYGTLARQDVIQPAINLATEGVLVTPYFNSAIADSYDVMAAYPDLGALYLDDIGLPPDIETVLTNPDLAKSLQMIADGGKDAFYTGEMAKAFVDAVNNAGGIMTTEDLANYEVEIRTPVMGEYRGYKVISSPPASSGGTHLIQILNILENFDIGAMEVNSAEYLHLFSESFKIAFADRSAYMADPDFTSDVPLEGLTSKEYGKMLSEKINLNESQTYSEADPYKYQSGSTTHFSIADAEGNIVSCTQTINHFFGSGVVVPGYGFIANDEMDDFDLGTESVNKVEPGKRPLSSMSPTIVLNADDTPFMVVGTPGGTRIFPTVAQMVSHVIDHGMDVQDAINTARIYDSSANNIDYESGENGIDPTVIAALQEMGHPVTDKSGWNNYFGGIQAIVYQKDGTMRGGADPRRDGKAFAF